MQIRNYRIPIAGQTCRRIGTRQYRLQLLEDRSNRLDARLAGLMEIAIPAHRFVELTQREKRRSETRIIVSQPHGARARHGLSLCRNRLVGLFSRRLLQHLQNRVSRRYLYDGAELPRAYALERFP